MVVNCGVKMCFKTIKSVAKKSGIEYLLALGLGLIVAAIIEIIRIIDPNIKTGLLIAGIFIAGVIITGLAFYLKNNK